MSDPEDDSELFRNAIGPVRPVATQPERPRKPAPRARARMREADERAAWSEFRHAMHDPLLDPGDVSSYRRDEVPPRVLAKLRNGEYAARDELDLHGLTVAVAESLLREFLRDAIAAGTGCVRIIHGKGRNSEGLPVIKNLVDRMLRQRADVLAFHSAPPAQGGTGAVLVLLKHR